MKLDNWRSRSVIPHKENEPAQRVYQRFDFERVPDFEENNLYLMAHKLVTKAMTRGFTIKIFVPNGSADGLRIVEKSNWSGRGIVCPRADYADNKKRPDFQSTGVYILIR